MASPNIRRDHRIAEAEAVARLLPLQPDAETSARIGLTALRLAERVRAAPPGALSAESFLRSYGLTTPEGVAHAVRFALENPAVTGTTLLVDGGQHLMKFDRDFSHMQDAG